MTPQDLLALGFHIFPVDGKMPLVRWTLESSSDREQILRWIRRYPSCGWGVDTGKSGLFVLDDDRGKHPGAQRSLDALEFDNGPLPATFTVRTKSGGYHYYYKGAGKNSSGNKLGPGLDTRGQGGFVVAPGSPGYDVVLDFPIAPVPDWLIDIVGRPTERKKSEVDIEYDRRSAIDMAIEYLLSADPAIEGGGGDAHTYRVACRVRDYGVSEDVALDLLLENWNDVCSPPWDADELQAKVRNAYQYAAKDPGNANPELVFEPFIDTEPKASRYKLLRSADVDNFPALEWLVKGIIPSRGIFQIYGPWGSGKSFLIFDMLATIAEGQPWFDRRTKACPTVYLCLEGEAALKQRKQAWEKQNGRPLPDNFYMIAQGWCVTTKKDVEDLASVIPQGAIVAIDTQNRAAPTINESASEDMGKVIEGARLLERLIGGVVAFVAHPGKDMSRGVRGHYSQPAAMDAVIELRREGEVRTWKALKVKDGRDGFEESFRLGVIGLGYHDEDGDEVTSCIIDRDVVESVDADFNLSEMENHAWQAIKMLASESRNGEVSGTTWKDSVAAQTGDKKDKLFLNRFYRARNGLRKKFLVAKKGGMYVISALTTGIDSENEEFSGLPE